MSKNIFDEALENIKDNYPLVHPTSYKLIKESYDTLEELIKKAKKQEKLLKLYREHFLLSNVPKNARNLNYYHRLNEVLKQIKGLENNEN